MAIETPQASQAAPQAEDLWVFGYGSLMWNPGFPFAERRAARLVGHHRAFCIYSTHHRGSHEKPGLVLGLDRGGICLGAAYRVAPEHRREVLLYLRAREQVSGVYREARVHLELADEKGQANGDHATYGRAFVVEPKHPSYTGVMTIAEQARLIRAARGLSGPNVEYLVNTWRQLGLAGIRDRNLDRIVCAVGGLFASRPVHHIRAASDVLISATRHDPPYAPLMRRHARRRFMHRLKLDALNAH
ncbi:MAG: gamma-glutamylcyclotransferase [Hyphomicrobiaceae bacterium]